MSRVTNAIFAYDTSESMRHGDNWPIAVCNEFFNQVCEHAGGAVYHQPGFKPIHDAITRKCFYGGTKHFEAEAYVAALNYFDPIRFLEWCRDKVRWENPENVQLILKGEDDERFHVLTFADLPPEPEGP